MSRKRPENIHVFRPSVFFPFLPAILFCVSAAVELNRPLWFDEALTILNFALLDSPGTIYRSYVIPNNQILHTIVLHWHLGIFSPASLRLIPVLCGAAALLLLRPMGRRTGKTALFTALTVLSLSWPFTVYGTALRGYMLGAAAVSGGVWMVDRYLECGKFRFLTGWFIFSLLSLGTMPGTLAALAGSLLYAMSFMKRDFWKQPRLYLATAVPAAAFLLFYIPIWPSLLKCAALGEGWADGGEMLAALGAGIIFAFPILLIAAIPGTAAVLFRKKRFGMPLFRSLIWLLPIPTAFLFKTAPFPRVFFPMFPLYILLLAHGFKHSLALIRRHQNRRWILYTAASVIAISTIWSILSSVESFRSAVAFHSSSGQDDFIDFHFMKSDFAPRESAALFKQKFPAFPEVYATFAADPWALLYAFSEAGISTPLRFDGPGGRYRGIPQLVIKHRREDPVLLEKRFGVPFRQLAVSNNHAFMVPVYE